MRVALYFRTTKRRNVATEKKTILTPAATPLKCGLIMPISAIDGHSAAHWEHVKAIIVEALHESEFEVEMVSELEGNGLIHNRIVTNIFLNDIVICDVSSKNPNVMFELGMRLAFDKPVVIIKDDKTTYSFDATPIEHLGYPADLNYPSIQAFKTRLRETTVATHKKSLDPNYQSFMKNFGQIVVTGLESKEVSKDEFFMNAIYEVKNDMKNLTDFIRTDVASRRMVNSPRMMPPTGYKTEFLNVDIASASQFYEKFREELGPSVSHRAAESLVTKLADEYVLQYLDRDEIPNKQLHGARLFIRDLFMQIEQDKRSADVE